jgi:hypothetical protein
MHISEVRNFAMALLDVTEEPHHHFSSFRRSGRIFVTLPPGDEFVHIFLPEPLWKQALLMYPGFSEKLVWGSRVIGVRITLASAESEAVLELVQAAWEGKAPAKPKTRRSRKSPRPD